MKQLFSLLALFIALNSFAGDFYKAKIQFVNGETTEGFASLPSNYILSGSVKIKAAQKGKATKLDDDDIARITFYSKNGNEYIFEHTNTRTISKGFGMVLDKVTKKKVWLIVDYSHPLITYYRQAQHYIFDKDENMILKTVDRTGTWAEIFMLLKRPNEEAPACITSTTFGAMILNHESVFRKTAIVYFNGDKAFTDRIDNKEFKSKDMPKLVEAYIMYKKGTEITKE